MTYHRYMRGMRSANTLQANKPLSDHELLERCPSIFAENAHHSRSSRYAYLPTQEVVTALRDNNFHPFFAAMSKARDESKAGFTKHMLRFRHRDHFDSPAGEFNEVVLVNSHDGTTSYQMMAGRYRMVCGNGLIAGDTFCYIKYPHKGVTADDIIEGAFTVLNEFDKVDRTVDEMKQLELSPSEVLLLGNQMMLQRFDQDDFRPHVQAVVAPRRREDEGNHLWEVFNRVQENVIRGGLPKTVNPTRAGQRGTTREITSIGESTRLNRSMWTLAEQMLALKNSTPIEELL